MDKVVHFEIPADDVKRAENFYCSTFGWKLNSIPEMKYTIVNTVEVDEKHMPKESGAINGGMMKRSEKVKNPVITISVKDIDVALKEVEKNGGKVIVPKITVGDMGLSAYFQDTEGNVLGIWQYLKK